MLKFQLGLSLFFLCFQSISQSTRMSLYESFCGETCPPCYPSNILLHTLLTAPTNTSKAVGISWHTPIPSAPSNTWSLYQTNKIENDWRWKQNPLGYGYNINSVPNGRLDGQSSIVFGALSDHTANMTNTVIATAQSYTTPFSIYTNRTWDATYSSINLNMIIFSSSSFTAVGNLICRVVMIEREIHFPIQPGTNGEKDFYNVAIRSFPTLQAGTPMSANWISGQGQSFLLNCPLPSYVRSLNEVAFVVFIQDDGDKKIWQTTLVEKTSEVLNDAEALRGVPTGNYCSSFSTNLWVKNKGLNTITNMTIVPSVDNNIVAPVSVTCNIFAGDSALVPVWSQSITQGPHTLGFNISNINNGDYYPGNNQTISTIHVFQNFQGNPVVEGFAGVFPPLNWSLGISAGNSSVNWVKINGCGGYQLSSECCGVTLNNVQLGKTRELFLPSVNLLGASTPSLTFDLSYGLDLKHVTFDSLKVYASTDCGLSWFSCYSKYGQQLATALDSLGNFVPSSKYQWRTETVPLNMLNNATVALKFVAISGTGNRLYIDNINLSQKNSVGISNTRLSTQNVDLYPNPGSGIFTLKILEQGSEQVHVTVVNQIGQKIMSKTYQVNDNIGEFSIDLSSCSSGLYQVIIEMNTETIIKKLNLSN
ncbi:MAG: T9SS type A sorting domain-containing protein [bacterium]|nr:T9SS type A sorting domain-containing protein [bacterium]